MKHTLLLLILLAIGSRAFAQVNTEKYRIPRDLQGIAGYFELNGTVKTGNADKTEAGIEGRLDWQSGNSLTFLVFESDYEWVDGERSSNEGLLHIRHVQTLTERLKAEAFGQINYDKKLLVDDRELIGSGLRYVLFKFSRSDITIGTAYMFEHENYDLPKTAIHVSEAGVSRWSNYLTCHFNINNNVRIGGVFYYQPMFSNFSDYRVLFENNLGVKLSELLSFSVNFKLRHDSIPADGIDNLDTKTDFGIAIKF